LSDRLDGVALVTGGGRGIGERIARELASAGMRVAVSGRTAVQVQAVASELGGVALVGDITKEADVERVFKQMGKVDIVVNNGGIASRKGRDDRDGRRRRHGHSAAAGDGDCHRRA